MNNIWTKKNNKLIMKSTTKNYVSNYLNLRVCLFEKNVGKIWRFNYFYLTLPYNNKYMDNEQNAF